MLEMLAQGTVLVDSNGLMGLGAGLGAGLTTLGAAKGIGHLAGNAVESMARHPLNHGTTNTPIF